LTVAGEPTCGCPTARHRDGLRVRLAHAAVARHSVELHRVTAWGEAAVARSPARRDALTLGAIDRHGVAARRVRPRRRCGHREAPGERLTGDGEARLG